MHILMHTRTHAHTRTRTHAHTHTRTLACAHQEVLLAMGASLYAEDHMGLTPYDLADALGHTRLLPLLEVPESDGEGGGGGEGREEK